MKSLLLIVMMGATTLEAAPQAASKKTSTLAKEHESLFSSFDYLQVDFTQKIFTSTRNKTRTRTGKASFAKPGNFHWRFDNAKGASEEEYFYDGKTLSHYLPLEKVVTSYGTRTGLQRELQDIVHLVLDAEKLFDQYEVVDTQKQGALTLLKLTPRKKENSDIATISVSVSSAPKYVKEVKIEYTGGNYTAFIFAHPTTSPIPAERFRFVNPGGVKESRME